MQRKVNIKEESIFDKLETFFQKAVDEKPLRDEIQLSALHPQLNERALHPDVMIVGMGPSGLTEHMRQLRMAIGF